ncbi:MULTISPECIES: CPBP family intramembrane glutamic endopeptidase [Saliphagus]|uniref:CPBP family intramembrane glutamic endopeptidase n=1 Tax=Saliphagus infecundisoli TaxID=1849069 RepID=A0ABD5QH34_9EURY|nr:MULTISPECIES: CPBP family intramembrane glutamic endopeptidase [Saliphagus]
MDTLTEADGRVRSVLVAVALTVAGLLASQVTTLPAILVEPDLALDPSGVGRGLLVAFFILNFLGFAVAGAAYLAYTGLGWSFVDLRTPSLRDWKYAILGIVASFGFVIVVSVLATVADLSATDNQVVDYIGDDSTMALYLIVIAFLFNAPAEEFLWRNVIQKRLYAAFSRMGAVVVTSLVFAGVHFPVYAATAPSLDPTGLAGVLVSLLVVFGGSIVFGYVYVRTRNLVVPIVAHAGFNAIQFGFLYLTIEYAPEDLEAAMALVRLALPVG